MLLLSAILTLPATLWLAFAHDAAGVFGGFALVQFATGLAIGVGPAATQQIASSSMRGRLSAVCVFVVNLLGLGLGPVAVGMMSDDLFSWSSALQSAMVAFAVTMALLAIVAGLAFRAATARCAVLSGESCHGGIIDRV